MTDEAIQFPSYPKPGPSMATHQQAKPIMKLMVRALQGRKGKSIFNNKAKRKKVRVL